MVSGKRLIPRVLVFSPVEVIRRGAEAEIGRDVWMGRKVIVKSRVTKGYRHPELDTSIRVSRTKNEARLIQDARRHGVPTPIIYDIDLKNGKIVMEEIEGERVKDVLDSTDEEGCRAICRRSDGWWRCSIRHPSPTGT